jgi:hypothetical protein
MMIDQNGHMRFPEFEGLGRDLLVDPLAQLAWKRRPFETGQRPAKFDAFNHSRHAWGFLSPAASRPSLAPAAGEYA